MLHNHSLEGLPPDRQGMLHLMAHAVRMGMMGLKSERQVEDVRKHLINSALAKMPPREFDHLKASGLLDQLQEAAGPDDGEDDPEGAPRRQYNEAVSAMVHLLGSAAGAGYMSHEQALEHIAQHFGDLPEGVSAREIIEAMLDRIHAGGPPWDDHSEAHARDLGGYLVRKYGRDTGPGSGDEVDAYIARKYGKRR